MTALNFCLTEDAVYVVADTLATSQEFTPAFFTTKVYPVPHWNGLICGRGSPGLILDWLHHALCGMLAVDLVHVDEFAPDTLRRLFSERPTEEQDNCTTSIYHLGLDLGAGIFRGYAYKSVNGFVSEPLGYGVHTKPGIDWPVQNFPDDFVSMMRAQRDEQDQLPPEERCFIGGQVLSWMMERVDRDGVEPTVRTTILPAYEWEDFEEAYAQCMAALPVRFG